MTISMGETHYTVELTYNTRKKIKENLKSFKEVTQHINALYQKLSDNGVKKRRFTTKKQAEQCLKKVNKIQPDMYYVAEGFDILGLF